MGQSSPSVPSEPQQRKPRALLVPSRNISSFRLSPERPARSYTIREGKWRSYARHPPAPHTELRVSRRYQAFREDDGEYSPTYWNLLAIRLAFVIVFEVSQVPGSR